jgi:type I restriction enzyme R subunit
MANPTLVVLTDRNDLDDQLFATFAGCKDLIRQTPVQANDREHLKKLLSVPSGGVIFTTIQKFSPEQGESEYPMLTDRRNVVVIADEAHRSQYGFKQKLQVIVVKSHMVLQNIFVMLFQMLLSLVLLAHQLKNRC